MKEFIAYCGLDCEKCVNKDKKSRPSIEEAIQVIQRELDLYIKEK